MANITVGPAFEAGGNTVEMTTKGKLQITNSKGKVKTLSQDEFKKNLVKNVDKINNGENFEFKKDRKGLKIFGAALATAVVATSVIYRKQIAKFFKEFSFKKLGEQIKDFFTPKKARIRKQKREAKYSIREAKNDAHRDFTRNADIINFSKAEREQAIKDAEAAFSNKSFKPAK
jgi:hypothetical protein